MLKHIMCPFDSKTIDCDTFDCDYAHIIYFIYSDIILTYDSVIYPIVIKLLQYLLCLPHTVKPFYKKPAQNGLPVIKS